MKRGGDTSRYLKLLYLTPEKVSKSGLIVKVLKDLHAAGCLARCAAATLPAAGRGV